MHIAEGTLDIKSQTLERFGLIVDRLGITNDLLVHDIYPSMPWYISQDHIILYEKDVGRSIGLFFIHILALHGP